MAVYFVSDVHLQLDEPERAHRFARWVDGLRGGDRLYVVGDLCDFWFASRQRSPLEAGRSPGCPGLHALAEFHRRGGSITIMPGNHDVWLGPFYERTLGARFVPEPVEVEAHGLRLHLVHGHLLGARSAWKAGMESRSFLLGFGLVPDGLARRLKARLDRSNEVRRAEEDRRHRIVYRRYADSLPSTVDIAVFGHIHTPSDDQEGRPRLVVLGGWMRGTSYLRVDDAGATLVMADAATPDSLRPEPSRPAAGNPN